VQQVESGNGFTTFVATPVVGVENLCAHIYSAVQTLEDLIEDGIHEAAASDEGRGEFETRVAELVRTCLAMKCVENVRHIWAVKHFVAASKDGPIDALRGEILLNQERRL
jgi:hypothetical protein